MGIRVLIVDDSAFMRNLIKNAINGMDITEIYEEGNADGAISRYNEKKPDLVFMDIIMPGKSGLDALKQIRSTQPNAKIVMCTSVGQEKIVEEAVNAGAHDFITKPFKVEEIKEIIMKLQQSQGTQMQPPPQFRQPPIQPQPQSQPQPVPPGNPPV